MKGIQGCPPPKIGWHVTSGAFSWLGLGWQRIQDEKGCRKKRRAKTVGSDAFFWGIGQAVAHFQIRDRDCLPGQPRVHPSLRTPSSRSIRFSVAPGRVLRTPRTVGIFSDEAVQSVVVNSHSSRISRVAPRPIRLPDAHLAVPFRHLSHHAVPHRIRQLESRRMQRPQAMLRHQDHEGRAAPRQSDRDPGQSELPLATLGLVSILLTPARARAHSRTCTPFPHWLRFPHCTALQRTALSAARARRFSYFRRLQLYSHHTANTFPSRSDLAFVSMPRIRFATTSDSTTPKIIQNITSDSTTPKIIQNIQEKDGISDPADLDGYEELLPLDQARVARAFADGHVAGEDIPDSARHDPTMIDQADSAARRRNHPSAAFAGEAAQEGAAAPPNAVDPALSQSPPKRKPGRPPKNAAAELPAPSQVVPQGRGSVAPAPKKRGRPPKNPEAAPAPAAPVMPQEPAVASPKKRGRPPKNAAAAPAPQVVPPPQPAVAEPAQPAPKKRGRPPKNAAAAAPASVPVVAPVAAPVAPAVAPAPPAKKRGRPSKASLAEASACCRGGCWPPAVQQQTPVYATTAPAPDTAAPTPKKRGRPPKNAAAAQASPLAPAAAPATPVAAPAKKRGRPKKEAADTSMGPITTPPLPPAAVAPQAPALAPATPPSATKKRGRPPKEKTEGEEAVKRPRGRPKKSDVAAAAAAAGAPAAAALSHLLLRRLSVPRPLRRSRSVAARRRTLDGSTACSSAARLFLLFTACRSGSLPKASDRPKDDNTMRQPSPLASAALEAAT
ncbi:hypothetical protein L1887_59466 [Cichorium endivia]|nr:hypothetical protein L1887_59466 [Cichorium endivia]